MMDIIITLLQGGEPIMKNKDHRRLKKVDHIDVVRADFLNIDNKYKDNKAKDVDVGINNMGLR